MIAYCGLDCSKCEAYLATIEDNDVLRAETAQKWSRLYQHDIKPEQINCTNCKSGGEKFFHCNHCEIRQCCEDRTLEHCAACQDYICETLAGFINLAPQAGEALSRLRNQ